ncbi:MAG: transglycosylase SLT domain-containing protein [Persicimonas sp.]
MIRQLTANFIGLSALVVLISSWSVAACAQESGDSGLESAGDEAKFRVISRFPSDDEPAEAPSAIFEEQMIDGAITDAIAQSRWDVARLLVSKQDVANQDDAPYMKLLAGYLALQDEAPDEAFEILDGLVGQVGELEDYRLFWAAKSAYEAEDFHKATMRAAKVPRESLVFGHSLILLADSLAGAGGESDLERAVDTLELYLSKYPNGRSAEAARLSLAEALEKSERWDAAALAYRDVVENHPLSDSAKTAKEQLDSIREHLSESTTEEIDSPPFSTRMMRYRALFGAHRSEVVVDELGDELETLDEDAAERCEATYLVAKSYSKLRRHSDGADWYERILDDCAQTPYAIKALYVGGKGLWNSGKQDDARQWFERIWTEYGDHSFADDAMYFSARILREDEKKKQARKLLQKQVQRYPSGDMAKDAHWLMVRELFAGDDFEAVVKYVDGLEQTGEDDMYSRGRLHYFRARALEKLGKADQADTAYRKIAKANPLSYYAYLSFNRLGLLAEGQKSGARSTATDVCALGNTDICEFVGPSKSPAVELPDEMKSSDHFKRGAHLLRIGLTELAEDEFHALRRDHHGQANLWALTYLLDAAGAYRLSHDLARRHIDGWQTHYPKSSDDPRWSLAFPQPFRRHVDTFVEQRDLPAALVYAIMREESGFNPRIESWANARGLLQLMESTASGVAEDDGLSDFSADKLFDPAVNIRLGTGYIEELAGKLESHPALVIAGYNGGHSNVSRWLKERGDLPLDLWVEDIPYGQTRKYTKRVLSSFWTYSWLYGEDRVPRISFDLP